MKWFRFVVDGVASDWLDASQWTVQELIFITETSTVKNWYVEYR